MVRLDAFLFGYRRAVVRREDSAKLSNILLKSGLSSDIRSDGSFILRERDISVFRAYADGRIRYTLSDPLGLPGAMRIILKRQGLIFAIVLFALFRILLGGIVWDIRVEGNETLEESVIITALEESGFSVGEIWRRVDKNGVETAVLDSCEDISWITINRRGVVAYVRVMEAKNVGKGEVSAPKYSNILADRDAVIEEITVERGVAAVKVGDVVHKGDVLISGVVETESGTVFCRAEGTVIGQSVATVSAEIPKYASVKTEICDNTVEIRLNLFKISINIFKNYGICLNDYAIIDDEKEYALFGKHALPFSITRIRRVEYKDTPITHTEDEMLRMARDKLNETIRESFSDCEVLKMRSNGEFREDTYALFTEIVYLTDITNECEIEVS